MLYFFYKNMLFGTTIFCYNAFTAFSGQFIYNDFYMTLYNVVFTALTPIVIGMFDRDLDKEMGLKYPGLYCQGACVYCRAVLPVRVRAWMHACAARRPGELGRCIGSGAGRGQAALTAEILSRGLGCMEVGQVGLGRVRGRQQGKGLQHCVRVAAPPPWALVPGEGCSGGAARHSCRAKVCCSGAFSPGPRSAVSSHCHGALARRGVCRRAS